MKQRMGALTEFCSHGRTQELEPSTAPNILRTAASVHSRAPNLLDAHRIVTSSQQNEQKSNSRAWRIGALSPPKCAVHLHLLRPKLEAIRATIPRDGQSNCDKTKLSLSHRNSPPNPALETFHVPLACNPQAGGHASTQHSSLLATLFELQTLDQHGTNRAHASAQAAVNQSQPRTPQQRTTHRRPRAALAAPFGRMPPLKFQTTDSSLALNAADFIH